jgi:hypothetical protein
VMRDFARSVRSKRSTRRKGRRSHSRVLLGSDGLDGPVYVPWHANTP